MKAPLASAKRLDRIQEDILEPSSIQTNRRILFSGEFWFGASGDGLAHGLRKLGWDICTIDNRDFVLTAQALPMRVASRLSRRVAVTSLNEEILRVANAIQPTVFLTIKGSYLRPATIETLRANGVRTVMYYPDFHFDHPNLDVNTFPLYDFFFTTKSFQVGTLRAEMGVTKPILLHHGYSSHVHYPRQETAVQDSACACDCLFVGTYSRYKAQWLGDVVRNLPHVKLSVVGSGWTRPTAGTALAASCAPGHLLGDLYARSLQFARLNLAFHHGPAGRNGWQDLVSTRTFEIPACKGFMLHIDSAELREHFAVGTEVDVFSTPDELCEKIAYYIEQPELRRDMVERAYARCVPAYSYDARAKTISDAILA